MLALKTIAATALCVWLACATGVVPAPLRAQQTHTSTLRTAAQVGAPTGERCEVPVLWWMRAGNRLLTKKCDASKHEVGKVRVRATIDRDQPMALIVEWQIMVRGKIKFRCTGPIALHHDSDNDSDRFFRWETRPNQDLQAVNLYVTVDGWSALDWDATSRCARNISPLSPTLARFDERLSVFTRNPVTFVYFR